MSAVEGTHAVAPEKNSIDMIRELIDDVYSRVSGTTSKKEEI